MAANPIKDESITDEEILAEPVVRAPRRPLGAPEERLSATDRVYIFWEDHRKVILGVLGALVALALIGVALSIWRSRKNDEANERLAATIPLFEQGKYAQALRDSTGRSGLMTIADSYGGTKAGNLANFYAASALYETKRYDDALRYFRDFDGEGTFLGASALAAEASILENKGQPAEAAAKYVDAADDAASELFAPGYLLSAARTYLAAGQPDKARTALDRIKEDFAETPEAQELEFLYGQIDAKTTAK